MIMLKGMWLKEAGFDSITEDVFRLGMRTELNVPSRSLGNLIGISPIEDFKVFLEEPFRRFVVALGLCLFDL